MFSCFHTFSCLATLTPYMALHNEQLLIQIASYNTNLQGVLGLPQDLVDWLSPTFQVSSFLSTERRAPDIVAVGFQELLPLHLGRKLPSVDFVNYVTRYFIQLLDYPNLSLTTGMLLFSLKLRPMQQTRKHTHS